MLLASAILPWDFRLGIPTGSNVSRYSFWKERAHTNPQLDIIITPNQLTAGALVIQYWVDRDTVNPGVFIAVFLVAIIAINNLRIKFFRGII